MSSTIQTTGPTRDRSAPPAPSSAPAAPPAPNAHAGFSLIELLVVIGIIGVLIGVLMPALSSARDAAILSSDAQNLRQLGIAVHSWANDNNGRIPLAELPADGGPDVDDTIGYGFSSLPPYDDNPTLMATSAIYRDDGGGSQTPGLVGLGRLLDGDYIDDNPLTLFSPGDDSTNGEEELEKAQTRSASASSSYFFRQRARTDSNRLDNLGQSYAGLDAQALVMNVNSLFTGGGEKVVSHKNRMMNVLYHDGHVSSLNNSENHFSIPESIAFADIPNRLDQIFVNADYVAQTSSDPENAPDL